MSTVHTLGPIAAKTVEAIRIRRSVRYDLSQYVHATIAVRGEARAALEAYDSGWIGARDLEARLRDILAICEAAEGAS